jgi:hypothetical protein
MDARKNFNNTIDQFNIDAASLMAEAFIANENGNIDTEVFAKINEEYDTVLDAYEAYKEGSITCDEFGDILAISTLHLSRLTNNVHGNSMYDLFYEFYFSNIKK